MASLERLSEPLHRKLNVSRLKLSPAFDLGLISILRIALEIFLGVLPRVGLFFGELHSDKRVSFYHPTLAKQWCGHLSAHQSGNAGKQQRLSAGNIVVK
jgi:hypothetical protein